MKAVTIQLKCWGKCAFILEPGNQFVSRDNIVIIVVVDGVSDPQVDFTNRLEAIKRPWVYLSHVYFVDFER